MARLNQAEHDQALSGGVRHSNPVLVLYNNTSIRQSLGFRIAVERTWHGLYKLGIAVQTHISHHSLIHVITNYSLAHFSLDEKVTN